MMGITEKRAARLFLGPVFCLCALHCAAAASKPPFSSLGLLELHALDGGAA